jgi:hydroxyacylglutathione hydrolase
VIPPGARIVLLSSNAEQAAEATRQLLRVGLDGVVGYVEGGAAAWNAARLPTSRIVTVQAGDLDARIRRADDELAVIDVRNAAEWDTGHIDGAVNIPVTELVSRIDEIRRDRPVATICETGYRSAVAASILARAGAGEVIYVDGGMKEFRLAER